MAAILVLLSAITRKLRQVETFCLLLTPRFKGLGISCNQSDVAVMVAILDFVMAALFVDVCACNVHVKCNVIVFLYFQV